MYTLIFFFKLRQFQACTKAKTVVTTLAFFPAAPHPLHPLCSFNTYHDQFCFIDVPQTQEFCALYLGSPETVFPQLNRPRRQPWMWQTPASLSSTPSCGLRLENVSSVTFCYTWWGNSRRPGGGLDKRTAVLGCPQIRASLEAVRQFPINF